MARRRTAATIFLQNSKPPVTNGEVEPVTLPELIRESQDIVFTLTTVFPFVLFTDKVVIRLNHIDVVRGVFFWSAITTRVEIADIRQVTVSYNPFFATMEITPQGPLEHVFRISFLWRGQTMKAKRIIAGLMECHQKKVDFSQYAGQNLSRAMEEIGKTRG
jgi:hypothetical protein